jgi:DNA-binding NtrC family response regulator
MQAIGHHGTVLIVDEKAAVRRATAAILERQGIESVGVGSPEDAIRLARKKLHNVILVDPSMPRLGGRDLVRALKQADPHALIVVTSGYATLRDAAEVMRVGAFEYLPKPIRTEELAMVVKRAFERFGELAIPEERGEPDFAGIVGVSAPMQRIFDTIRRVAASARATVLIDGESGTGKEVVAQAIHRRSKRRAFPFISLHCSAIPTTLLESELFGHEKGAFTGATRTQKGKFELADRGTLLLDEVGTLEERAQIDLLRVLQERAFTRIGGSELIQTDARVIATTNEPLEKMVREKQFREDLYYRLNVVRITLPPLRERVEDIPLLADRFREQFAAANERPVTGFTAEAMKILCRYSWPGNARQLENVVERAIVMGAGPEICEEDLGEELRIAERFSLERGGQEEEDLDLDCRVGALERELILRALDRSGFNRVRAAERLGIAERTLRYKIRKLGIDVPRSTSVSSGRQAKA